MSTNLQDFREQYPQYSDLDDEALAESIRTRWYSDMDVGTYRESMGLPALEKEPPPPTVWDRVKSIWGKNEQKPASILDEKETQSQAYSPKPTPEFEQPDILNRPKRTGFGGQVPARSDPAPVKVPRALYRDQLFAGFDEMMANQATADAFDAIDDYRSAEKTALGTREPQFAGTSGSFRPGLSTDSLMKQYRSRQLDSDDPLVRAKARAGIDTDIATIKTEQIGRMQQALDRSRELRARAATVPYSKDTRDMLEAETFGQGLAEFTDDPINIVIETSLRSLPNMAEALPLAIAGAMMAGPLGFAAGMGLGAGMTEYRSSFAEYMKKQGVDIDNAESLVNAAMDDDLMRRAHDYAGTRSAVIAITSGLSGGLATKPLTPFVKNIVGKELSNVAAQTVAQAALEGTGEAIAQVASGEDISPGEVLAEMTGGLAQTPIEVGAAAVTGVRAREQQQRVNKIKAEIEQILGDQAFTDNPDLASDPLQPPDDGSIPAAIDMLADDAPTPDTPKAAGPLADLNEQLNWLSNRADDAIAADDHANYQALALARDQVQREIDALSAGDVSRESNIDQQLEFDSQRRTQTRASRIKDSDRRSSKDPTVLDSRRPVVDSSPDIQRIRDQVNETGVDIALGETTETNLDIDLDQGRRQQDQTVEVDRRQEQRRDQVERMSIEEQVDAVYIDPLTQIGNLRAFNEEIGGHPFVGMIDGDSMKWVNDNLGYDAGDAMLVAIADALNQPGIDAYRVGGDEFYIGGASEAQIQAALSMAEGILANQTLSSPNGSKAGIEITTGIGTDKASAASSMQTSKKNKKNRAGSGALPTGVTLSSRGGKVLDMESGTNFVPIIGETGPLPINADNNYVLGTTGKPVRIPKTPVRREHIIRQLRNYFGNRIYSGRVKGKLRLGFYRPGHGEVRIKKPNDFEVAAHEIAHFLDERLPWIKKLYQQYAEEVNSVSYDTSKDYEGWAEFARLWLTQDHEAMQGAPSFYDAFNKELNKHPKLEKMLLDLQEIMHAWSLQGARKRGLSKQQNGLTALQRVKDRFLVNIKQSLLDGLRSLKPIAANLVGDQRENMKLAYTKLRLATGGANSVLQMAFRKGTPGWRSDGGGIEVTGESLLDIFGNWWGDERVAGYMVARRAQELMKQGREKLMRTDEIVALLAIADEIPEVVEMFDRYQAFNKRILDFAEGAGILNADTRIMIEEMNQNYVPFHRVIESQITGQKVRNDGNPFQRLKGGTNNINNIWDNIIQNLGLIIRTSMINDGKRTLLQQLGLTGGEQSQQAGVYAAPIPKEVKPVRIASEQVLRKTVEAMGITWKQYQTSKKTGMYPPGDEGEQMENVVTMIERMAKGMDDMATFFQLGQDPQGDVDFYMDNGKKHFFEINDPDLWDTLQFLRPKGLHLVYQITGTFSAILRRGVTATLVFQTDNFLRDGLSSWGVSQDIKVPFAKATQVIFSKMEKDPDYIEMMINGGGFADRLQGLAAQRKLIVDPTRLVAAYDRIMTRFEVANRLAEFKAARKGGKSPRDAALMSREVSTDFAMRGSSEAARGLAVSVTFLNARVQSLYRLARLTDSKSQMMSFAIRGIALAGVTMALYSLNKEDERYKDMPEDWKDLNWVFFTGDGEDDYYLHPKPFEFGSLFGTLPERMMEYIETQDGKEFADAMGWMLMQTFSMDMTPQIFKPGRDLEKNKNFTGSPIIPGYLDNVDPGEQYTYYTSETVREAAQKMGISPIKLQYRIRGYLGTMGTYLISASDALYQTFTDPQERPFGEYPTRGETWKENVFVKAWIDRRVNEGPMRRSKHTTDLYDMARDAQRTGKTLALIQLRYADRMEEYLADPSNYAEYATAGILDASTKQIRDVRVAMDRVRADKEMTGDEKRIALWDFQRTRLQIAKEASFAIKEGQKQAADQAELEAAAQ